jgi:hypothetical protein
VKIVGAVIVSHEYTSLDIRTTTSKLEGINSVRPLGLSLDGGFCLLAPLLFWRRLAAWIITKSSQTAGSSGKTVRYSTLQRSESLSQRHFVFSLGALLIRLTHTFDRAKFFLMNPFLRISG